LSAVSLTDCQTALAQISSSQLQMPDAYRVSLSVTPADRLQLVAEAVRRNYSNLSYEALPGQGTPFSALYRDVTELHAGAEYRLPRVALRAGWWSDPSHVSLGPFPPGYELDTTQQHVTLGAGIDVGSARIDLAYDNADAPALRRATVGVTFGAPSLRGR